MPTITVNANTNIVLVNTASDDQTTVNLPVVNPGQLITIRDNAGGASSNNPITITTICGTVFSTGTILPDGDSNILIRQPFGAVTVGYSGAYKWNILNTFAFENPSFAKVDAVTVSSITFRDSGGNGSNYQLNVNNDILYKDGIKIIEAPEFNLGIARHNGGVSSMSSIVSYGLSSLIKTWAAYPATCNVNMSNFSITNVSNLIMYGELSLPNGVITISENQELLINGDPIIEDVDIAKFTSITLGPDADNIEIANSTDESSQKILKLTGNTFINGSLRLNDENITGPDGSSLTYNGGIIGGDITQWATEDATANVDMNNFSILDLSNLTMIGTFNLGGGLITYSNSALRINNNPIGGAPSNWAAYPATSNLNIGGCNISNVNTLTVTTLTVNGVGITGGGAPSNWAVYPATSNLNIGGCNISNVNTLTVTTLTVNGVGITGGGAPSNWAVYPATSNLNIGGCNISNVNTLTVGGIGITGVIEFPSNTTLLIPSFTDDTGKINRVLNGNNVGFVNLGTNEIIYDIFYNNSLWVAVGETSPLGYIYTSSNGTTWNKSASAILLGTAVSRNIIYASNIWVLVGFTNADQKIAYSTDGYNWSRNPNTINVGLHCIGYNGSNKWVIGGQSNGWTLATLDNITSGTFTPATGGFTDAAFRVLYANNIWVAVGRDTNNKQLHYSTNASQWYPSSNTTAPGSAFFSLEGKALAYGNGYWLAGGDGNNIYGSSNGINFSVFHNIGSGLTVDDIKYESGSTFYATFKSSSSNILVKSTNNGSNWSIITYIGLNSAPSRIGISYNSGYSISSNTINTHTINTTTVNTTTVNTSTVNTSNIEVKSVTEFPSNTTLLIPSYTGIARINRFLNGNNVGFINLGANEAIHDIFYNGSLWIAVGETRPSLGYIYTSTNGTTWNKSASLILTGGAAARYSVIYASNIWVFVAATNNNPKLAYSTDGYNWSTNPNTINQPLFCVGYNGSNKWVIGGQSNGWTLATLDNITSGTFTPATGGFTNNANRVLYGNNIWVAVGIDTNVEIQYSTNGSQWYPASNTTAPNTSFFNISPRQGKALAYGNGYWLVGGNGQNIYGSSNGINFSVFHDVGNGTVVDDIKYESGSTFYAVYRTTSSNILAKSINNGSNWSIITNIGLNSTTSCIGISYIPSYSASGDTIIGGGTLNTSNLTVSGSINTSNLTVTRSITLNSNTFTTLVNPVGAYIEIRKTFSSGEFVTSTYPLYIGNSINITRTIGWWSLDDPYEITKFSGIILLPNYLITYASNSDQVTLLYINNLDIKPSYTALTGNYQSNLYYTLSYNPT